MLEKIIFNESCAGWTADRRYNLMFVGHAEIYANDMLTSRGWLSLNDVYGCLGMPKVIEAQIFGWRISDKDNANNYIKFDIQNGDGPNIEIILKNMVKLL